MFIVKEAPNVTPFLDFAKPAKHQTSLKKISQFNDALLMSK